MARRAGSIDTERLLGVGWKSDGACVRGRAVHEWAALKHVSALVLEGLLRPYDACMSACVGVGPTDSPGN